MNKADALELLKYGLVLQDDVMSDCIREAVAALEREVQRDNPEPLTLDQLREMDGNDPTPVWLVRFGNPDRCKWALCDGYEWRQGHVTEWIHFRGEEQQAIEDYGKTWLAYAHKPKEV